MAGLKFHLLVILTPKFLFPHLHKGTVGSWKGEIRWIPVNPVLRQTRKAKQPGRGDTPGLALTSAGEATGTQPRGDLADRGQAGRSAQRAALGLSSGGPRRAWQEAVVTHEGPSLLAEVSAGPAPGVARTGAVGLQARLLDLPRLPQILGWGRVQLRESTTSAGLGVWGQQETNTGAGLSPLAPGQPRSLSIPVRSSAPF